MHSVSLPQGLGSMAPLFANVPSAGDRSMVLNAIRRLWRRKSRAEKACALKKLPLLHVTAV
jgi:hypothetical protein